MLVSDDRTLLAPSMLDAMIESIRTTWVLSSSLLGVWFVTARVAQYDLLALGWPHVAGAGLEPGRIEPTRLRMPDRMCGGMMMTGLVSLVILVGTLTFTQLLPCIIV